MLNRKVKGLVQNIIKVLARTGRDNRGMTLLELLISLTIMGFTVVFVGGLFTGFKILPADQDAIKAESIGRSQMEYTMTANYTDNATSYAAMSGIPSGYFVPAPTAVEMYPNIGGLQKITVYVYKGSSATGTPLLTLIGYKLKK